MDAKILILILFLPIVCFGQKSKYPKDTIYIKFKDSIFTNTKMKSKSIYNFQGKNGIKFWWKGKWMFYDQNRKADTLYIKHLKNYKFLNLKEIDKKRHTWIFDNKRPPVDRNGAFQTYLVEVISKEKFVIYPVIWRNEGVID